eukprot:1159821-Pelagomonas_calceolata.AAC.6
MPAEYACPEIRLHPNPQEGPPQGLTGIRTLIYAAWGFPEILADRTPQNLRAHCLLHSSLAAFGAAKAYLSKFPASLPYHSIWLVFSCS